MLLSTLHTLPHWQDLAMGEDGEAREMEEEEGLKSKEEGCLEAVLWLTAGEHHRGIICVFMFFFFVHLLTQL